LRSIEWQLAGANRVGQGAHSGSAAPRETDFFEGGGRKGLGSREHVAEPFERRRHRIAEPNTDLPGEPDRRGDRDLLTQNRANREFERFPGSRYAQPWSSRDKRPQNGVTGEDASSRPALPRSSSQPFDPLLQFAGLGRVDTFRREGYLGVRCHPTEVQPHHRLTTPGGPHGTAVLMRADPFNARHRAVPDVLQ
jgi:hypothetical protein